MKIHYSVGMDKTGMPEAKRSLIVDDDADGHEILLKALRETGRYLESAFNGT